MAKSKLGIGTIDINKKFKDKEEAMKYAKRLQQYIRDLCKRKGWQASAMIGISGLKKNVSNIVYEITGKRGRPRKKVVIDDYWADKWYKGNYYTDWHLHILIVSKPSYAFRNAIKKYIDKNWKDIANEHEVKEFNSDDLGKKEVYKKKCNIKLADYFIWQSEEVRFCYRNCSGEKDLKYTLKQYYYGYLTRDSAILKLARKNKEKPMSEEKYFEEADKIENKFKDIINYFLVLSKKDDEERVNKYMKEVQRSKIAENYEKMNNVQKNDIHRRRIIDDSSPF